MIIYQPPVSLPYTPVKVAFLTGLSDPSSCSLNRAYRQFMVDLGCPEAWKLYLNFPYIPGDEAVQKVPLWKASLANFRQFLGAKSPRYREAARRHLASVAASADTLFLVVGSCGLEILNQAWTDAIDREKVRVFAWGPVAYSRPQAPHTFIQGTRDYISRRFFKEVDVLIPDAGHMDYVHHPNVLPLVSESLWSNISRS